MRILRIVSSGYRQGGVEDGIVATNERLRDRGHDVRVISSDLRADQPHFSDHEFPAVPSSGVKKLLVTAFNYRALQLTRHVVQEFQPDVVLLHTMQQATGAVLFALDDVPTVQCVHGPEVFTRSLLPWHLSKDDYGERQFDLSALTWPGRLHYVYFRYICGSVYRLGSRHVDRFVVFSRFVQRELAREGTRASYMPNGARLLEPAGLPDGAPVLCYVGRLERYKGIDDLLQAIAVVSARLPEVRLLIAGDGSERDVLTGLAGRLGIADRVSFLGQVSAQNLRNVYRQAHALVIPSTWPETFGKVGIEAMSVGRPVVGTSVGGMGEWLRDGVNGRLVSPHQPHELASAIIDLLDDPERLEAMARAAIETAQAFSMEAFATNLEQLLEDVVEAGGPKRRVAEAEV